MTQPAVWPPRDRLIRKEVALGTIREIQPPQEHIGLSIAPFEEVDTDDVIIDYLKDMTQDSLAPARAQTSEAELAQSDIGAYTSGRASVIDWSLKHTYNASDVMNYTDRLLLQEAVAGQNGLVLNTNVVDGPVQEFQRRLARDENYRARAIANRLEWLIMTGLEFGKIGYNDGRIKFGVNFGRPGDQQDQPPDSGNDWDAVGDTLADSADPIGDIDAMNEFMYNKYGVKMTSALCATRVLKNVWKNARFQALTNLISPGVAAGGSASTPLDMRYLLPNWDQQAAIEVIQNSTGVTFQTYDSVYRVRGIGSTTKQNIRFLSDNKIVFRPSDADMAQVDPDGMGFAKTLTSPHPEGNWQAGPYEWENPRIDPWELDRGNGIKAFPIYFFAEYSYVMQVLDN